MHMAQPLESRDPLSDALRAAHGPQAEVRRAPPDPTPLERFEASLKGRQQVALLIRLLGQLGEHRCLFISEGRGRGALHFHLRAAGGCWTWAGTRAGMVPGVAELLGESVNLVEPGALPFENEAFDRVVIHHLHSDLVASPVFRREINRILVPGGITVWTAPNGHPRLPLNAFARRRRNGSSPTEGRAGLQFHEMEALAARAGLAPLARGACSRFFTELIDRLQARPGPVLKGVAILDHLLIGVAGYEVAISARKPSTNGVGHP
jgi:SAM-dependent methyltransferase